MAAGATDVVVRFLADVSDIAGGVKNIDSKLSGLGKTAKRMGTLIGGAFAVREIGQFINAAEEADAVSAGLAKALGNAGDATGEWAKHAEDLADTLSHKVGIDDEVIKRAETILATFHTVAGATGQASGAFDRATQAAIDLSKAGFGDASSTATMLGKALEDPITGLTSLRRVGVNFTDDQEKLIKSLVESGDQAGAMNEVLKVVESQVGGVAEASATSGDKMRVAWGETQEALGKALLPVLQSLAPVLETIALFVQQNATWLVPLAVAIAAVVIAVKAWIGAQTLLNALMATFGAETTIALGPIILIAVAVAAVVAAVVLLYAKWDEVWSFIGGLPWYVKVAGLILLITNPVAVLITAAAALGVYWNDIWAGVTAAVAAAYRFIAGIVGGIVAVVAAIPGQIAGALASLGGIIVAPFQWAWEQIVRIKDGIVAVFESAIQSARNIWNAFARFWNGINVTIGGQDPLGAFGPSIPEVNLRLPHIPELAQGGIVTGRTLALLGESGPEAVIPLDRVGGNITINITTTGLGADAPQIQRAVVAALRGHVTRNGPITGIAG